MTDNQAGHGYHMLPAGQYRIETTRILDTPVVMDVPAPCYILCASPVDTSEVSAVSIRGGKPVRIPRVPRSGAILITATPVTPE